MSQHFYFWQRQYSWFVWLHRGKRSFKWNSINFLCLSQGNGCFLHITTSHYFYLPLKPVWERFTSCNLDVGPYISFVGWSEWCPVSWPLLFSFNISDCSALWTLSLVDDGFFFGRSIFEIIVAIISLFTMGECPRFFYPEPSTQTFANQTRQETRVTSHHQLCQCCRNWGKGWMSSRCALSSHCPACHSTVGLPADDGFLDRRAYPYMNLIFFISKWQLNGNCSAGNWSICVPNETIDLRTVDVRINMCNGIIRG